VVNLAAEANAGDLVSARLVDTTPHSLIGEPLGAARPPKTLLPAAGRADEEGRSAQL
jgi:hypothetical protein